MALAESLRPEKSMAIWVQAKYRRMVQTRTKPFRAITSLHSLHAAAAAAMAALERALKRAPAVGRLMPARRAAARSAAGLGSLVAGWAADSGAPAQSLALELREGRGKDVSVSAGREWGVARLLKLSVRHTWPGLQAGATTKQAICNLQSSPNPVFPKRQRSSRLMCSTSGSQRCRMYSRRGPSAWLASVAISWHGLPFSRPASCCTQGRVAA